MTSPELELGMQSYPPALLVAAPASASRMRARVPVDTAADPQAPSPRLGVGPDGYIGQVKPADRPRNLEELAARVDLTDSSPWPAGMSLAIGQRGKRAHWTGTEWKGGESPGYPPAAPAESVGLQLPAPVTPADTPDAQFPGDETAGDLHR